ncbi:MAG: hypothetical protein KGH94_05035 [Candidatus Micrarchaeota archaeon]|nr:hypothetical protein [Candidatus Micrarchaeota archaeon]
MDDSSVNFIELVALTRITPESTVEKFGSLINSSFFDASNILAGLKTKGFVDFVTAFPSQSTLKITDKGTALLKEATAKAAEPLDPLDSAMLAQLSGGTRNLAELGGALNVAQKDLALHIYKLSMQQYLSYELVNAVVSMHLTEKGFVASRNAAPQEAVPAGGVAQTNGQAPEGQAQSSANQKADDELKVLELIATRKKRKSRMMIIGGIVVVIAVFLVLIVEKIIVL